jgi:CRP-like cAMP-binding protein
VTTISLLDADPDLADAIPVEQLAMAGAALSVPLVELDAGPWDPEDGSPSIAGFLVVEGVLLREVTTGDVGAMELLGPGDIIVPTAAEAGTAFVNAEVRWLALLPSQHAVLHRDLFRRLCDWPDVLATIFRRGAERSARQAVMQAICHQPRVDARLRGLFWHLAERWGRVTSGGVVLPLRLTHESLARLVGAQRPTVSTALKSLQEAGEISRRRDGAWVLLPESQERLESLQRRVAALQPSVELIANRHDAMADSLERLQIAWQQQSASVMTLRQRAAELRAEAKELAGGLRRMRENGNDGAAQVR